MHRTVYDQYNDLDMAKYRKFDFIQSHFLGEQALKIAVDLEKMRVMANGRKLRGLVP